MDSNCADCGISTFNSKPTSTTCDHAGLGKRSCFYVAVAELVGCTKIDKPQSDNVEVPR